MSKRKKPNPKRKKANPVVIDEKTFWHPAFLPVLQLELEAYLHILHFETEHHLTTKPLQIDVVVIKKDSDEVIDNPIAGIFRKTNLFEYKSPTISLSLEEFYKGIVYVFLYASIHKADVADMSLSIVLTRHPAVILDYIRNVWKYEVTEQKKGIYIVRDFLFPIQIIENKKLSKEHNAYLKSLNNGLDDETLKWAIQEGKKDHKIDVSAYVDVVARANEKRLEEMLMIKSPALEKIVEEVGLAARWEERGKIQVAQNLIKKGWDNAEVAETTGLDLATVESLMGTAQA